MGESLERSDVIIGRGGGDGKLESEKPSCRGEPREKRRHHRPRRRRRKARERKSLPVGESLEQSDDIIGRDGGDGKEGKLASEKAFLSGGA